MTNKELIEFLQTLPEDAVVLSRGDRDALYIAHEFHAARVRIWRDRDGFDRISEHATRDLRTAVVIA
jgi:hypothetical protein